MLFADNLNASGTKEKGCKNGEKNRDFDSVQRGGSSRSVYTKETPKNVDLKKIAVLKMH